jgi:membrane fusion protein (multidrug efflux system)
VFSSLLVACGGEEVSPELGKLLEEKSTIEKEYKALGEKLSLIDAEINSLNGVVAKTLSVKVFEAKPDTFEHYFEVLGLVEADNNVQLNAEAAGTVKNILVKEGQFVKAGTTLLTLNTDILDNNIAELENVLELATFTFEKQSKLWEQKIGSELQFRQAKNNHASLEQKLKAAKSQRDLGVCTAPFSGTVDQIFPKVGESVAPGMPLTRIVNLNNLEVVSDVPENFAGKIKRGTKTILKFEDGTNVETSLKQVGSFINPANRTFRANAYLNATDVRALPNQTVKMALRDYLNLSAITVPSIAIQQDLQGSDYVFIAAKKGANYEVHKTVIKSGLSSGNLTEILSGLQGTENIIIEGARSVKDGDLVEILK